MARFEVVAMALAPDRHIAVFVSHYRRRGAEQVRVYFDGHAEIAPRPAEVGLDDEELIVGQGTVGLEIYQDWPEVEHAIVPIGGGGLISGVATALKACNPAIKVVGVESSGAPGMTRSVREGRLLTLDTIDCIIDGLRVKRANAKALRDPAFDELAEAMDDWVGLCTASRAYADYVLLAKLAERYGRLYSTAKAERSALDFEDLELMARDLLRDGVLSPRA